MPGETLRHGSIRYRAGVRVRTAAAAVTLVLLAGGCIGRSINGPAESSRGGPAYVPSGMLLVDVGGFSNELGSFLLPKGPGDVFNLNRIQISTATGPEFFGGYRLGSFWGQDHAVYTMVQSAFGSVPAQLVKLQLHRRPVALGGPMNGVTGFALSGHTAVASTCSVRTGKGEIFVMDVEERHPSWRALARGCVIGVSPDGTDVAYTDHATVWEVPVSGSTAPRRLVSLDRVAELARLSVGTIKQTYLSIELGAGGLAVTVDAPGEGRAIVVVRSGHRPQVIPLGTLDPGRVAWQPNGRLLAFGDSDAQLGGIEVRLFDPATGRITQVAAVENYGQFVWSPDGKVLAVARSGAILAFVDTSGNQLAVISGDGVPDGWTS